MKDYDVPQVRVRVRVRCGHDAPAAVIPEKRKLHGRRPGRPPAFDRAIYRRRNAAERRVGRPVEQCRRVATRYDEHAVDYSAFARLAMIKSDLCRLFYEKT